MSLSDAISLVVIEQGAVDRGADLSWLSQYADADRDIVFPPVTCLELRKRAVSGVAVSADVLSAGAVSSGRAQQLTGGEVHLLTVDAKVAWPRTASAPGRKLIGQLERTRGALEGRLAEQRVQMENLQLSHDSFKAERDSLQYELTRKTAKLKQVADKAKLGPYGGRAMPRVLRPPADAEAADDADAAAASTTAAAAAAVGGGESGAQAAEMHHAMHALHSENAQLKRQIALREEALALRRQHEQATAERYQVELDRYREAKLSYGYTQPDLGVADADAERAGAHHGSGAPPRPRTAGGARAAAGGKSLTITGGRWLGGELTRGAEPGQLPASGTRHGRRTVGGPHTAQRFGGSLDGR